MVPPCSSKISRVPLYSSSPTKLDFRIQGYHLLWPTFPGYFASFCLDLVTGLFPFRSPLLRKSQLISFPLVTKMFQFSRFASTILYIQMEILYLCRVGFPIRKSPGQSLFVSLPKLIADYYVLHRLMPPRHPPHALIHLTL